MYSLSKKHSEELAIYYCKKNNIPLTILRPSQIYDEKGEFRKHQPLLYLMVDSAQQGKDIYIYGSNDALRNYIHVKDLVEVIARTIATGTTGVYSCINPNDIRLVILQKQLFLFLIWWVILYFLKTKKIT